ncbi:MAG: hypothetical protein U0350_23220 [Caldilineaceae bacterium]
MAKDRSLVRASDIGAWAFCQRAWWLAHVQGVTPHNQVQLQQGKVAHVAHGQAVIRSVRLRQIGVWLLALGLLLALLLLLGFGLGWST